MATIYVHDVTALKATAMTAFRSITVRVETDREDSVSLFFSSWQAVADAGNDLLGAARVAMEPEGGE